jgi:predicted ATPase/DNA-binding winged helix-turn-helix (wHTH) protein
MNKIHFSNFELDLDSFELRRDGDILPLGGKPLDLLIFLARNRGRVVSHAEIVSEIWDGRAVSSATVPTSILEIRKTLGDAARRQEVIASVRGRGYRFVPKVRRTPDLRIATNHGPGLMKFVGRSSELDLLNAAARHVAQSGFGRSVSIAGAAGMGKTRLVQEFAAAASQNMQHITARCSAIAGAPPYWPFIQVLRIGLSRTQSTSGKLQDAAQRLSEVHPEITRAAKSKLRNRTSVDRFSLFGLWIDAIGGIADGRPTAIIIEDLHLADTDSLDLLSCLAEEVESFPILLVTTRRHLTTGGKATQRLSEIEGYDSALPIELAPLKLQDIQEILEHNETPAAPLAETLTMRSSGVPFYIAQLLRYMRDTRSTAADPLALLALPEAGSAIVARQLSDLPPETQTTLAFASLIGDRFTASLIADATGQSTTRVCRNLGPSIRAGFIAECRGSFHFEHSLLREALSATLDPAERKRSHLRIAQCLMQADDLQTAASQVADQLAQALPLSDPEDLAHFSGIAANDAEARFAFSTAAHYHSRTLEAYERIEGTDPSERCRVMILLARSVLYEGNRARAREILFDAAELARRNGSPDALAACALQIAPDFLSIEVGTNDARHIALLEEALAAQPDKSTSLRSRLLACLSQALRWTSQPDKVLRLATDALSHAEELTDPEAQIAALSAVSEALHGPAHAEKRLEAISRLETAARATFDIPATLLAYTRALTAHLELGNIESVEAMNQLYRQLSDDVKLRQYRWYPLAHDATLALMRGDLESAEKLSNQFRSTAGSNPDQNCLQTFAAHHALRLVEMNRSAEALPLVEAFDRENSWMSHWRAAVPWLYWDSGEADIAKILLRRVKIDQYTQMAREPGGGQAIAMSCELAARLGDLERCEALYSIVMPAANCCAVIGYGVGYFGSMARYAGLVASALDHQTDARDLLEHAVAEETSRSALSWQVYAQADLTLELSSRGDSTDAYREKLEDLLKRIENSPLHRAKRYAQHALNTIG